MLVRWTLESRKRRRDPSTIPPHITMIGLGQSPRPRPADRPGLVSKTRTGDSNESIRSQEGLETFRSNTLMARTTETEEESRQRRAQQEERAIHLRDDKLLDATRDPRQFSNTSEEKQRHNSASRASHALTKENVDNYNDKVEHEDFDEESEGQDQMREMVGQKVKKNKRSNASGSAGVHANGEYLAGRPSSPEPRPELPHRSKRWNSEVTVTK